MDNFINYLRDKGQFFTAPVVCRLIGAFGRLFNHGTIMDPAMGIGEILAHCSYGGKITGFAKNSEHVTNARDLINGRFEMLDFLKAEVHEKWDLIVSQLPFTQWLGQDGEVMYSEKEYMEKLLPLLNPEGTMIVAVPYWFLTGSYSRELRDRIIKEYSLEMIMKLPKNLAPELKFSNAMLIIRNTKPSRPVYMAEYSADIDKIVENYKKQEGSYWVGRDELVSRWDRSFNEEKYRAVDSSIKSSPYRLLGDIAEVHQGPGISREESGGYSIFSMDNVKNNALSITKSCGYTSKPWERFVLKGGDIVISKLKRPDSNFYYYRESDSPCAIDFFSLVVRSKHNPQIAMFLNSSDGRDSLSRLYEDDSNVMKEQELKTLKIPDFGFLDKNRLSGEYIKNASIEERVELIEEIKKLHPDTVVMSKNLLKEAVLEALIENGMAGLSADDVDDMKNRMSIIESKVDRNNETTIEAFSAVGDGIEQLKRNDEVIIKKLDEVLDMMNEVKSEQRKAVALIETAGNDLAKLEGIYEVFENKVIEIINSKYDIKNDSRYESEEADLKKAFDDNWDKLTEESRLFLITARVVFRDLEAHKDKNLDFSPACVPLTKAFEKEIKKYFYKKYRDYLLNVTRINIYNLPEGLSKREDEFTLGSVSHVTGVGYTEVKEGEKIFLRSRIYNKTHLTWFIDFIGTIFKSDELKKISLENHLTEKLLKGVDNIRTSYRNKVAHTDEIRIDDVKKCYDYMITGEKILINFMNKLKREAC